MFRVRHVPLLDLLRAATGARADDGYPTNTCVARKLNATAGVCKSLFEALGKAQRKGGAPKIASAVAKAKKKLARAWQEAEATAAKRGVDCKETTATADALVTQLVADAETFAGGITGARAPRLLSAAGLACHETLKAEGELVAKPDRDPQRQRHDKKVAGIRTRLGGTWRKLTKPESFTKLKGRYAEGGLDPFVYSFADQVGDRLGSLTDAIVFSTTVSPAVPDDTTKMYEATAVDYDGRHFEPICSKGTPYAFFAKRGTVNKVFYYFQGGGACFDHLTCSAPVYDDAVDASDDPALFTTGFANLNDPRNPFRDWNVVFVSYCTADIHWGDNDAQYPGPNPGDPPLTIHHRGYTNARVVEKWAREHFVDPDEVFVSGSSAGAYGAITGAAYLMDRVWLASHFDVVGDAGNGVITQDFLVNNLANWKVDANTPRWIPALDEPATALSIDKLWSEVAKFYPTNRFGQYTTAFDGGNGGQTFFYNVMVNVTDVSRWGAWWHESCNWNAKMRQIAAATSAAAENYRYYIGSGSRHTAWGSDKVYADATGGVSEPVVGWIDDMLAGSRHWQNVACTDCGLLLPDDPRPSPLEAPFEHVNGADRVVCQ